MTQQPAIRTQVQRRWTPGCVRITTINPTFGPLYRGRIDHHDGTWIVSDQDGYDVTRTNGDYLDAETALLNATTWADDIDENHQI